MRLVDAQYTEVYLAGGLGKKFGRLRRLVCKTPGQAMRLIGLERPDFKAHMVKLANDGVNLHVISDRRSRTEDELSLPAGKRLIISMEVSGAKGALGGILEIVAAVALVVVAWWNPAGWTGAAWLAAQSAAYATGASLLLGGITSLLTHLQKGNGSAASLQSYAFNGPVSTQQQGSPVPVVYGRMLIGGQAISASLNAVDSSAAPAETGPI